MTFIATVIAKKGAVLIADSLVTTSRQVLEFEDFYAYLKSKNGTREDGEIKIDTDEVIQLFQSKPSHTKDFQEKLFEYDKHIAIATAGAAEMNDKSMEEIIQSAKKSLIKKGDKKRIGNRIDDLSGYLNKEAVAHLKKGKIVRHAVFIVTYYSVSSHKTTVYRLNIKR